MPTRPPSALTAVSSPLSVSLIRTSRMASRSLRLEGPVAADRRGRWGLVVLAPGRRGLLRRGERFAPRPIGAGLDLLVGGLTRAFLALLGLAADPLRLRLELVAGASPSRFP